MTTTKRLNSYGEPLFYIAFGLFLILRILLTSSYSGLVDGTVYDLIYSTTIAMFGASFICSHISMGRRAVSGLLILIVSIVAIGFVSGGSYLDNPLIHAVFIFYLGRQYDFRKLIYITIVITLFLLIFIDFSSRIGIINERVFDDLIRESRYYLGFRWVLYAPTYAFNITALYIYLKKKDIQWWAIILMTGLNTYYFVFTKSRLTFACSILIIIIAVVLKLFSEFPKGKKPIHVFAVSLFPICAGTTALLTFLLSKNIPWVVSLDRSVELRITNILHVFEKIGLSLIGHADKVYYIDNGLDPGLNIYLDNLYAQVLLLNGIIIAAVLLVFHTIAVYKSWKTRDYYLEIILCILALHGLFDDLIYMIWYNTFWVFALAVVFPKNNKNRPEGGMIANRPVESQIIQDSTPV